MKPIKNRKLLNLLLFLSNIFIGILIIKEFKILDFCYTVIILIAPIFWGYALAWLIKPIMLYFNKRFKTVTSVGITYLLLIFLISLISYVTIPIIITEIKALIPQIGSIYKSLDSSLLEKIDISAFSTKVLLILNKYTISIKDSILTVFYSLFISFFFLIHHKSVSNFFLRKIPSDLINQLSINLKQFVKGTLLDTIILFVLSITSFYIVKMPYAMLFAILVSITNIIPYIGPYIGGIPAVIVAFNVSSNLGSLILIIIILLQTIESAMINPYIMSKSIKINPIFIIIGLIIFGYFFGVLGMLLSTPIVCIIKTLYLYNKEHKIVNWQVLDKLFY
ncbi:MAG: AI-2E family transporter [Bacilli bacterium]|nr:AI-2E family transporter [Bacilli bacterium]